jgi:hypothetical protein
VYVKPRLRRVWLSVGHEINAPQQLVFDLRVWASEQAAFLHNLEERVSVGNRQSAIKLLNFFIHGDLCVLFCHRVALADLRDARGIPHRADQFTDDTSAVTNEQLSSFGVDRRSGYINRSQALIDDLV